MYSIQLEDVETRHTTVKMYDAEDLCRQNKVRGRKSGVKVHKQVSTVHTNSYVDHGTEE